MALVRNRIGADPERAFAVGACERSALRLLRGRGHKASKIIRVDPYCITFVKTDGGVATAWVRPDGDRLILEVEPGMPAFPCQ